MNHGLSLVINCGENLEMGAVELHWGPIGRSLKITDRGSLCLEKQNCHGAFAGSKIHEVSLGEVRKDFPSLET